MKRNLCHSPAVQQLIPVDGYLFDLPKQEPQENSQNIEPIMRKVYSRQCIITQLFRENASPGPLVDNLANDEPVEFRMTLDCDKFARQVHALYGAVGRGTEWYHVRGTAEDDVSVHLVDAL